MDIVSILPHTEFWPNNHREYAPHFRTFEKYETGNVACRQLGYERVAQIGRDALGLETPSSAPIILEWVNCTGTEPSLSKCKAKLVSDPTKTDCSHTSDVQLRLVSFYMVQHTFEIGVCWLSWQCDIFNQLK